jgi:hypothetical protein
MSATHITLKYGLTALSPDPNPPINQRTGKPARDNRSENARLAVKILDLLCEEEGGELMAANAISALEQAIEVVRRYQTRIPLGALLPSNFGPGLHIESDRQS